MPKCCRSSIRKSKMVTTADSSSCKSSNNFTKDITTASNHDAKYIHHNAYNWPPFTLSLIVWCCCLLSHVTSIPGAAVHSNVDHRTITPTFEPICNLQEEHFIESEGKESSLLLEFNSAQSGPQQQSCTRILSAPPNYGFIIRLILPKIRLISPHNIHLDGVVSKANYDRNSNSESSGKSQSLTDELNTSTVLIGGRRCPLNIFSSHDPHTPQWRVDPCQLEDTAPEMEDPVRLFHGRVRIVWAHANQTLNSKLMVTVLGKGDQCRSKKKHQCLSIGDEPILCIAKELVCDGIRHCPYSNEYDSDEDYAMCWKRSRLGQPVPPSMDTDIFEHFALDVFRNLFAPEVPSTQKPAKEDPSSDATSGGGNTTLLHKISSSQQSDVVADNNSGKNDTLEADRTENATSFLGSHHHKRNGTRHGLNSDLSKYGPWGYLMLGMLLCGGALLICGLWASASQHAANNEREAALQSSRASSSAGLGQNNQSTVAAPPHYEELEPPPAYSVLFPNQKSPSNNTLTSLDIQSSQQRPHQLSPSAAPSSRSTSRDIGERATSSSAADEN